MPKTRIRPTRQAMHLAGDLVLLAWITIWFFVARMAQAVVMGLGEPVDQIGRTTDSLADRVDEAADGLGDLAVVGDALSAPFHSIAATLRNLTAQSDAQVETIHQLGTFMFLVVWLIPSLTWALFYVPRRIRRTIEAAQARRYIDERADLDLFALRAMSNAPMTQLARISDDPVAAWRRGDKEVIDQLADLELRRVGIGVLEDPAGHNA